MFRGCPRTPALIRSRRPRPVVAAALSIPSRLSTRGLRLWGALQTPNAVATMAGLSQGVRLESSLAGKVAVSSSKGVGVAKCAPVQVRASSEETQSRRAFFSLGAVSLAATALVINAHAVEAIKLGPPPLPFGGLPGTDNADQARDVDLPLQERFYLQPAKTPAEAAERVKLAVKDVKDVKPLIDRKAWPYVQNGLRSSASYLRYDLNTIGAAKSKEQKKAFKALSNKAVEAIESLDYAARVKSPEKAVKAYAEAVALLDQVIAST